MEMKMKKDKKEPETWEEKKNRWEKQTKKALSFAKQSGIDVKKLQRERAKNEAERRERANRTQFF
jgi:hypothetical protein